MSDADDGESPPPSDDQELADGPCGGALRTWLECFLRVHPPVLESDRDGGQRVVNQICTPIVTVPVRQNEQQPLADETFDWWPTISIQERATIISTSPFLIDWGLSAGQRTTLALLVQARHSKWFTALTWLGAWLWERHKRRDLSYNLALDNLIKLILPAVHQRTKRVWNRGSRETLPETLYQRNILPFTRFESLNEQTIIRLAALDAAFVRSQWSIVAVHPTK